METHGIEALRSIALLARELNQTTSASDAFRIALPRLSRLIPADALRITINVGEDRQQLRATFERDEKFASVADGEIVLTRHTMLASALETTAAVRFNDVSAELVSGALVLSLVCPAAQSVMCAPLAHGTGATGVIIASAARTDAYTEADEITATTVASLLAATLARIELCERAAYAQEGELAREREATLITRLDAAARSSLNTDQIIQHAIDALSHALPASFVVLRTVSFGRPEQTLRAWTPGADRPPLEIHAPVARAERVVYTEHRPIFIADMRAERATSHDLAPFVERLGALSMYISPVIYGGKILAAIGLVESDTQRHWSHDEQLLLTRVAGIIAPLILNAQLHGSLRSYIEDLSMLLSLARDLSSEAEIDRTLRAVLDSWSKITGAQASAILRWDEETEVLRLAASKHLPTALLEHYTRGVTLSDPLCGLAAERRVGVVADLASEARFAELYAAVRWSGLRGAWATPITGPASKLLGVMLTFSHVVTEASSDEQRLAELFTRPVSIAMQNLERSSAVRSHAVQVKQLEENLRQSERHKNEFMSIISHELRTPLNAIIGYAQMLREGFSGELNEQQRADVQTIMGAAERLLGMVEDTLDLARIDAQRFPIYMDTIAFDEVVRRAVTGVRSTAETKGLDIKTHIADDAPVVRTDPERVRQILSNLLSNAVKFTDTGSIHISVERAEAGHVQINVADTGIGFDIEAFPHIFEEFRQADSSNTRTHGGTGLGLAVSRRLVQRLGGNIGVISAPGEGSTFWFRLPPEIPGADL